jgi:hypothetical protein
MKKSVLFLAFTALSVLCGNISAQKITIGAKGGFSIPNLTDGSSGTPLSSGYSSSLGADYGIYGEYHVSSLFSISLGAEYSSQGGQKNGIQAVSSPALAAYAAYFGTDYLYADFNNESKLNYLLIPVLARFSVNLSKTIPLKAYIAAGPFAGFLLNAHQVTSGTSDVFTDDTGDASSLAFSGIPFNANTNIKDQLRTFNFGIEGLIGISYSLTPKHAVFIEGGGNYGFIPIQKDATDGKNCTGAGVVTLGYAYTF